MPGHIRHACPNCGKTLHASKSHLLRNGDNSPFYNCGLRVCPEIDGYRIRMYKTSETLLKSLKQDYSSEIFERHYRKAIRATTRYPRKPRTQKTSLPALSFAPRRLCVTPSCGNRPADNAASLCGECWTRSVINL